MTNYAKDKALAWAYIQYMTGVDGVSTQWQVGGNLPINSAFQVPSGAPPQVTQMLSDAKSHPTFSYVSALMKQATIFEWMKQMQLVLAGKESVDTMLQAVQKVQDQP
jgi:ABC-type glycerol-3-phosphate transport system substrate-binding protein